jgi:hypothetical protein
LCRGHPDDNEALLENGSLTGAPSILFIHVHSWARDLNIQDHHYNIEMSGPSQRKKNSGFRSTPRQQVRERGNAAYRGLIAVVQALSDCSDVFLPLKTACNVILTIHQVVNVRTSHLCYCKCEIYLHISGSQRASTHKDDLEELEVKLKAILSIVNEYKQCGGMEVVRHRIESFCECVKYSICLCCSNLYHSFSGPSNYKRMLSNTCAIVQQGSVLQRIRRMQTRYPRPFK